MLSAVIPSERSKPAVLLAEQLAHQRSVRPGPLVLGTAPLKSPARAADRDRTVSRRSKPSSRTALIGEQPNPWDLLQPQDATSRHRGAKPCRRYGLLGKISLLSPGYLLSVERRRFHIQPIKQVVFLGPSYPLRVGRSHLEECFPLICIQRLSQPNFATQPCRWRDSWNTRGSSIPVLSY